MPAEGEKEGGRKRLSQALLSQMMKRRGGGNALTDVISVHIPTSFIRSRKGEGLIRILSVSTALSAGGKKEKRSRIIYPLIPHGGKKKGATNASLRSRSWEMSPK